MLQCKTVPARTAARDQRGKYAFGVRPDTAHPGGTPARGKCGRKTVTLLVPTLNEIDGMKAIMPRVKRGWVDQILILDGGSTDRKSTRLNSSH